jgi:hypothetical protein
LYPEATPGVIPGYRSVNTGNHARAAFEASRELDLHLTGFLVEGIEVGRAGINTETLPTVPTSGLIEGDMAFLVIFESVYGQFLLNGHGQVSLDPA